MQKYVKEALRDKLPTELLFTDSKVGLDFESSSVILPDWFHSSEINQMQLYSCQFKIRNLFKKFFKLFSLRNGFIIGTEE